MNRWPRGLLQVIFAFVIVFLAGAVSLSVGAISHSQNRKITGIIFIAAVVCLVLFSERVFPSVYSDLRPGRWWQGRAGEGVLAIALVFIISILS
jgi:hypothetical protein